MAEHDLDEVLAIEKIAFTDPWSRVNFIDCFSNSYYAYVLRDMVGKLMAYFVWMPVVDEGHILNLSVQKDLQGQGLGRSLIDYIVDMARTLGLSSILLEVRLSNVRARHVYDSYGFVMIGVRPAYYPVSNGVREDAIVMRLML